MAARQPGSALRRLVGLFRNEVLTERWLLLGSATALGGEILFKTLEPWPLKFILDSVLGQGATGWPNGWTAVSPGIAILLAAIALVLMTSGRAFATFLNTLGFSIAGNRILSAIRLRLFEHLQHLPLAFHSRARSGDLVQRLGRDVDLMRDVLVTGVLPLVGNMLTLVVLAGVMLWMEWRLALVAIATLPLFALAAVKLVPRIHRAATQQRSREGKVAASMTETLGAMKLVKTMGLEDTVTGALARNENKNKANDVAGRRLAAQLERSVDVLTAMASASVLGVGAHLALAGSVSVGDLVVFLSYLKSALKPVRDLAKYMNRLAKAAAAGERLLEVFEYESDIRDADDAIPAPPFRGAICFDDVSFSYDAAVPVLRQLSLQIQPGERVAIVGPSGHGKSTIASLLLRFYDPTSGSISIDGVDLRRFQVRSLRRQINLVPQDSLVFGVSIAENIGQGDPTADQDAIESAARLVNAHDFICQLPDGYRTILGERGSTLSSGQRQRIALARAALRPSPILILDEPTTGLDAGNRSIVTDSIDHLARNRTTLIITHDLALALCADRQIVLDHGQIQEAHRHAIAG